MAIFDYKEQTDIDLIKDVLVLESINFNLDEDVDSVLSLDRGWEVLDGETLGYSGCTNKFGAFYGESIFYSSAECSVAGKYDSDGKLTTIGLSFWGTGTYQDSPSRLINTVLDSIIDVAAAVTDNVANDYVANAYNNLLQTVVSFARENGLTGEDIIVAGHSLGGMAVNSLATQSALGRWDGFFEGASYVALASPTQNLMDDKVLNIGYENDPVFRVLEGSSLTAESLFNHDTPQETATNNIVSFNDYYAGLTDQNEFFSIANFSSWAGHAGSGYNDGILRIMESEVYKYTNQDANIVVSNLSEANRVTTWVEDLNKSLPHEGSTFIIGTETNDLLKGGDNNDYLCGGAGNDSFKDHSGFNVIYGGEGSDTYITECSIDDINFATDNNGTLYFKYSNGDITKAVDIQYVNADRPLFDFLGITFYSNTNFTITESGLQYGDSLADYSLSYYAAEENSYTVSSDRVNSWLFASDLDSILYANAAGANIVSGAGNDTIYASGDGDSLLFYGDFGNDILYNLSGQENLVIMENQYIVDNDSYLNHLSFINDNAVLTFGDSSITLAGISADSLADMHFMVA